MKKQVKTVHRKPGRPRGTRYAGNIPVRLTPETLEFVDRWADQNSISRSEALRRLVERGLARERRRLKASARDFRGKRSGTKTWLRPLSELLPQADLDAPCAPRLRNATSSCEQSQQNGRVIRRPHRRGRAACQPSAFAVL